MWAVVMHGFGPPSVLVADEISNPTPGPQQVVVNLDVANITFVETQVRAGRPPNPAMLPALPTILGNGVGGVVAAVGEATDPALVGRRVVASLHGTGGYAERAVTDSATLIDIPGELSTQDAVALLADGRTALTLMRVAAVQAGETVLVEAAAGGVGSLLVQLARNAGARVVGAAVVSASWGLHGSWARAWWWTTPSRDGRNVWARSWVASMSSSMAWAEASAVPPSTCCVMAVASARSAWRAAGSWKSRTKKPRLARSV
jgi:NADPH:quinone reductase